MKSAYIKAGAIVVIALVGAWLLASWALNPKLYGGAGTGYMSAKEAASLFGANGTYSWYVASDNSSFDIGSFVGAIINGTPGLGVLRGNVSDFKAMNYSGSGGSISEFTWVATQSSAPAIYTAYLRLYGSLFRAGLNGTVLNSTVGGMKYSYALLNVGVNSTSGVPLATGCTIIGVKGYEVAIIDVYFFRPATATQCTGIMPVIASDTA